MLEKRFLNLNSVVSKNCRVRIKSGHCTGFDPGSSLSTLPTTFTAPLRFACFYIFVRIFCRRVLLAQPNLSKGALVTAAPDTMQSPGDFISGCIAAKFAAGVQYGHYGFQSRFFWWFCECPTGIPRPLSATVIPLSFLQQDANFGGMPRPWASSTELSTISQIR